MFAMIQTIALTTVLLCSSPAGPTDTQYAMESSPVTQSNINHEQPHWGVEITDARLSYIGTVS